MRRRTPRLVGSARWLKSTTAAEKAPSKRLEVSASPDGHTSVTSM